MYNNDIDALLFDNLLDKFYLDFFKEKLHYNNLDELYAVFAIFDNYEREELLTRLSKIKSFFIKDIIKSFVLDSNGNDFLNFLVNKVFPNLKNGFKMEFVSSDFNLPEHKEIWFNDDFLLIKEDCLTNI